MATPAFADMEGFVNSGVKALLGNAVLSWDDGSTPVEVTGIFSDPRNVPDSVAANRAHRGLVFELREAELGNLVAGTPVSVRGQDYTVGGIDRDKSGWVTLKLRGAA